MLGTRYESSDGHKFKIGIHANVALYYLHFSRLHMILKKL